MTNGSSYCAALIGITDVTQKCNAGDLFQLLNYSALFVVLIISSIPVGKRLFDKLPQNVRNVAEICLILVGLVMSTAYLVDSTYNPFLYFRF